MEYNKKIGKGGGVTLPADLRRSLGIQGGEKVVIDVNHLDGIIQIKRVEGSCLLCKANENLKIHEGRFICQDCIDKIKNL